MPKIITGAAIYKIKNLFILAVFKINYIYLNILSKAGSNDFAFSIIYLWILNFFMTHGHRISSDEKINTARD